MDASYCPTSRTFYWLRSVLMRELGLDRHDIRPSQALADLIPEDRRREVWRQLRRDGLALPPLRVSWRLRWLNAAHVLHAALEFAAWCNHVLGLVIAFPLGLLAYAATRQQAVHLNRRGPVTVRDAVLYLRLPTIMPLKKDAYIGPPWGLHPPPTEGQGCSRVNCCREPWVWSTAPRQVHPTNPVGTFVSGSFAPIRRHQPKSPSARQG